MKYAYAFQSPLSTAENGEMLSAGRNSFKSLYRPSLHDPQGLLNWMGRVVQISHTAMHLHYNAHFDDVYYG